MLLLQQLQDDAAVQELVMRRHVRVAAKLPVDRDLAVLGQLSFSMLATCFIALVCAAQSTRFTEGPAFTAGRIRS